MGAVFADGTARFKYPVEDVGWGEKSYGIRDDDYPLYALDGVEP